MKLETKLIKLDCTLKAVIRGTCGPNRGSETLVVTADTKYGPAQLTFSGPELDELQIKLENYRPANG